MYIEDGDNRMNIIEKNPRKNDNAVEYVANSISKTKKQVSNDG